LETKGVQAPLEAIHEWMFACGTWLSPGKEREREERKIEREREREREKKVMYINK